jgi:hypothetical protein
MVDWWCMTGGDDDAQYEGLGLDQVRAEFVGAEVTHGKSDGLCIYDSESFDEDEDPDAPALLQHTLNTNGNRFIGGRWVVHEVTYANELCTGYELGAVLSPVDDVARHIDAVRTSRKEFRELNVAVAAVPERRGRSRV